ALKKLHQEAKISTKKVVTAVPEGEVFSRVIELPPMSDDELAQAIPWEAEQFVPKPLSEVNLDWRVVSRGEQGKEMGKMKILLVAAPKNLIQKYLKVLDLAGFEVMGVETEMIAAARSLIASSVQPTMLLDFGAKTTDFAIINQGQVIFTRSIPTAGEAFTRAISAGLSLDIAQAEEYKRAYGMEGKQLEGKIKDALTPIFKVVSDEVKRALQSWKEKEKMPLSRLIMAGGTANLPQASSLLASQLGIEVQIADPFANLIVSERATTDLKGHACLFAVSVGLAMKEI
ncbi:MAG: type IV pilus assembly protein PilM, partial [bacterium]|nr:type IV pilus assembly protein PilM [bacterium]